MDVRVLEFFDSDFLDKTDVDIHRECFYDGGILSVPDHKNDLVPVRFGKLELLVEDLVSEKILIELIAILIFDSDREFIAFRIFIGDIEYQHVILHTEPPDRASVRRGDRP